MTITTKLSEDNLETLLINGEVVFKYSHNYHDIIETIQSSLENKGHSLEGDDLKILLILAVHGLDTLYKLSEVDRIKVIKRLTNP